ncbi:hypothetical protein [Rothia aeria]|uniref:hypothetical protein n=1 Tax=Rothia aeria TaxID=172042 RepID=UPI00288B038E|nr:hypothetical protein [Rothia aeria]
MHKLRILSVGAVMVLALSAYTAASTSSSSSSKSQSASSSRASSAASSSYTASATPTPKEQIDAKELIEHPEKAREYNFFTDVKFPITCPAHEVGKNPDKVPFESHNAPGGSAALTDDNKAGKPRPRPNDPISSSDKPWVKINDSDGSWTYIKRGSDHIEVKADGTWTAETGMKNIQLNPDGTFRYMKDKEVKTVTCADGSWVEITPDSVSVGDRDKEITTTVSSDGKIKDEGFSGPRNTRNDLSVSGYGSPGAGGVKPLEPRRILKGGVRL